MKNVTPKLHWDGKRSFPKANPIIGETVKKRLLMCNATSVSKMAVNEKETWGKRYNVLQKAGEKTIDEKCK